MSFDTNRINTIENKLNSDANSISNNDLFYYLQYHTKNNQLSSINLTDTENYLKKINSSFSYENIFANTSNYGSMVPIIIGLLLPFYYTYPRFYKLGLPGMAVGFICLLTLYTSINTLYGPFFKQIGVWFLLTTFIFYFLFFIILNKLNHLSLFFISGVISYLSLNYVCRLILCSPVKNNPFNKFRAKQNNNSSYTEYNIQLETACYLVINRFNLTLPSGTMLYSYLTVFQIDDSKTEYADFFTNLFAPLISIGFLFLLGFFLGSLKYNSLSNGSNNKITNDFLPIDLFPIIGINENSYKYFTCQANYILPKELNCNLLIHNLIDKYKFDDNVYNRIQKALLRISNELIRKYSPRFIKLNDSDKNSNQAIIKDLDKDKNKIFNLIKKILKKNNKSFENFRDKNGNYEIDKIKQVVDKDEDVTYMNKEEIYDILYHINNALEITYDYDSQYINDANLAKEVLLYDDKIDEDYKFILNDVMHKYIKEFRQNIGYTGKEKYDDANFYDKNFKNDIENMYVKNKRDKIYYVNKEKDTNILFGYHYNIMGYSIFGSYSDKIKNVSNIIFKYILRLLSTWLLLTKPIGSAWLISKYILISSYGFKKLMRYMTDKSLLWKYFSTGLDTSYFEDTYREIKNNSENTFFSLSKGLNLLYSVLLTILMAPLLGFYNTISFGFTLSPSWYNMLFQLIFFINIIGNIIVYFKNQSLLWYNIIFLSVLILLIIIISLIIIFLT